MVQDGAGLYIIMMVQDIVNVLSSVLGPKV